MDDIYQAPLHKRIFAGILDMTIAILFAIGLFMLLSGGVIDIGFHNASYRAEQFKLQDESGLFNVGKDESGNIIGVGSLSYDETNHEEYKTFVQKLSYYYFNYQNSPDKNQTYFNKNYLLFDEKTLKSPIFSINSMEDPIENYVLLEEVTNVTDGKTYTLLDEKNYYLAIKNFFVDENKGVYNYAVTEFTNSEKFQNLITSLATIERIEILICTAFSSLICISLPVLFNKNGETAFMHIFGICFTDSYGYKVRWRHKIIRACVIIVLNAVSVYLFLIPLAVNIVLCLATPHKRSLIDYASNEIAIDQKASVILD